MSEDASIDLGLAAVLVIFCLAIAAFLSAAETAFTAASRPRMLALEKGGDRRAGLVNRLLAMRERFIGAVLTGRTVLVVAATAIAAGALALRFGGAGILYAATVMALLVVVIVMVLPKAIAAAVPDRTSLLIARPLSWAVAVLGPVALAAETLARAMLRPLGVVLGENQPILSGTEEIRGQIGLPHKEGDSVKEERDMLGGLLDLREMTVADVMIHRTKMRAIDADLPSAEIVREVLSSPYTRMPLWRETHENIVGVLHAKDLLRALDAVGGDPNRLKVEAIALETWFVPDTTSLPDQLKAFLAKKTHFALVVDEYGDVQGLVTLEDILEEIVGDIKDEHDIAVQGVRPQPDGSVYADGAVPIRDLNRAMAWDLPDDEATTVAGLVIHEARAIPDAGQAFNFHGFRFQVLRKSRNRITALRITPLAARARRAAE